MIKLTFNQLNNPNFGGAITKLAQQVGFASPSVAYNVSRIMRQISAKTKEARNEFAVFAEAFTMKDENGKFVPAEEMGAYPFKVIPEQKEAFEAQTVAFFNTETTIESNPLTIEDLGSVEISPADLLALDGIISAEASANLPQSAAQLSLEQQPSH